MTTTNVSSAVGPIPAVNIERIYLSQLDPQNPADQATLKLHLDRYRFAADHAKGERLLDMACGCGYGSALLAERHPEKSVLGVDIDAGAIAYARAHYALPNLSFICADAASLESSQRFDTIVSLETIEHVPAPMQVLARMRRLLSDDGYLIASVPITPTIDGNPYHLHDFSRRSFFALLRTQGMQPRSRDRDSCFEQIQHWEFSGLFNKNTGSRHRSAGVGRQVLKFYQQHPLYVFSRLYSMLRYGFSNRYLTCVFKTH